MLITAVAIIVAVPEGPDRIPMPIEIDDPLFDAMGGDSVPWTGYGPILETTPELVTDFQSHVARARASIAEGFS